MTRKQQLNMGHFKGKAIATMRPDDKDLFIESGFTILDEHPEGRYCILAKSELVPREGRTPVPIVHLFHLKKFGPPMRLTWTRQEFERVGAMFDLLGKEDRSIVTIEVKKATSPGAWYRDHIGQRFEVHNPPEAHLGVDTLRYKLVVPMEGKADSFIQVGDCRIVQMEVGPSGES